MIEFEPAVVQASWENVLDFFEKQFNKRPSDLESILFLIGVQELGQGYRTFKKDEKLNLMHIAICKLLEPYGYYEFDFFDEEGWPHYKIVTELPNLKPGEQTILMKEAILTYFESLGFFEG